MTGSIQKALLAVPKSVKGLGRKTEQELRRAIKPGQPDIQFPEELVPAPQPIPGRAEEEAKKKVKRRARRGGRQSNILAGRLNQRSTSILKTRLG